MVTISDVARVAGVTPAVVSRVLNADPNLRVRDDTRQRVELIAKQLQYTPNHAARALRRSRTGVLGLAVHELTSPVDSEMLLGAQSAAEEAGNLLLIADISSLARGDEAFHRALRSRSIDGLLIQSAGRKADRTVAMSAQEQIPTVMLNDRSADLASVSVDDYAAARLATQHLLDLGHTRIGALRLTGTIRGRDRFRGFRDALADAGLEPDPRCIGTGGLTTEAGYRGMTAILRGAGPVPTAVFSLNVLAAVGALTAIREAGLRVPDDVSVIGFHDTLLCRHTSPSLTVVQLPMREMGAAGVATLLELVGGGEPRSVVLSEPPPVVRVRDSTAPPRAGAARPRGQTI